MTVHCWGERAEGEWTLEIRDQLSQVRHPDKQGQWPAALASLLFFACCAEDPTGSLACQEQLSPSQLPDHPPLGEPEIPCGGSQSSWSFTGMPPAQQASGAGGIARARTTASFRVALIASTGHPISTTPPFRPLPALGHPTPPSCLCGCVGPSPTVDSRSSLRNGLRRAGTAGHPRPGRFPSLGEGRRIALSRPCDSPAVGTPGFSAPSLPQRWFFFSSKPLLGMSS